jgi:UDP-N-acetylmuramate dehydrogenase
MKTIRENVLLKNYSRYKIGGPAEYFLEVFSEKELIDGIREWKEISQKFPLEKKQIVVLSGGSNTLIDDKGLSGLVIHNSVKDIGVSGNLITAGSGLLIKDFLDSCVMNSFSGFEWSGGLPGTIGGAIRGNAGAFGGETKDLVISVRSINLDTLEEIFRKKKECEFGYRTSIFKKEKNNEFILSAVFELKKGNKEEIQKLIQEKNDYRKLKHPMDVPSLGSTFKNIPVESLSFEERQEYKDFIKNDPIPVLPVVKLLHLANLKGKRIGDAQVSEKHPNFILNLGNATSEDVKQLIGMIKETIKQKMGIALEEEIAYLPK